MSFNCQLITYEYHAFITLIQARITFNACDFAKSPKIQPFLKLLSRSRRLVKNCLHEIPRCVIFNLNTTLSNQYYMSGKRSELAILVHELWKIDKYTYESCVATANYYSLREERTEAIEYFERFNWCIFKNMNFYKR